MHKRVLRYSLPSAELMLDVLNRTNQTAFTKDQVKFGLPVPVADDRDVQDPGRTNDYDLNRPTVGTLTRIEVIPAPETGWTKSKPLTYRREVIQDHFISVPFVIYTSANDKASILAALLDQCGLRLEDHLCSVEIAKVDAQQVFFRRHLGSIVENEGACNDYVPPVSRNAVIKINPLHPYWMGELVVYIREAIQFMDRDIKSTLEIKRYLGPGDHNKVPAEMVLHMTGFVDQDHYIKSLKPGDLVRAGIVDIAKTLTRDPWVFTETPGVFNLYGTKVIHNGMNTGELYIDDPRVTNVLVLEFAEEACTNIRGQWVFGYYNGDDWFKRQRADALPIQDQ